VVVHSKGGGVEVDSNSATITKSLRMRMVVDALRLGLRRWRAPRPGSMTAGGDGGVAVSRVIEE
jgi:hypothetical protein